MIRRRDLVKCLEMFHPVVMACSNKELQDGFFFAQRMMLEEFPSQIIGPDPVINNNDLYVFLDDLFDDCCDAKSFTKYARGVKVLLNYITTISLLCEGELSETECVSGAGSERLPDATNDESKKDI